MTIKSITLRGGLAGLAAAAAASLAAQTPPEIVACYDARTSSQGLPQGSGIVYRIKVAGVRGQQGCTDPRDVQFSWTPRHGALTGLDADDHPQYLLASGARALTGDLSAGGNKITGLAAASAAGHAVRFEQAVKSGDAAEGDLSGAFPNPTVAKVQGHAVAGTDPSAGQVLTWSGTAWTPTTPTSGVTDHGGLTGLPDDDHPQYLLEGEADARYLQLLARAADADRLDGQSGSYYLNASNVNSGRLALAHLPWAPGTANGQVLTWNGVGWAPAAPAPAPALAAFKSIRNSTRVSTGAGVTNLLRLDFTAPADGFVFASASGECIVSTGSLFTASWAYIIGTTAAEGWSPGFPATTIQSPAIQVPLTVQRVLPVAAGAKSIFLNVEDLGGITSLRGCAAELTAFFTTSQLP